MKGMIWFLVAAVLLLGCSELATAQCAGNTNVGGFDLLQTASGSQDDLSSLGLGTVSFSGVPLPFNGLGSTDTIVCRITPLPNPVPSSGATLNIQIVALLLKGDTIYNGQSVTVYATVNQTQNAQGVYTISQTQLPVPDQPQLGASTGTMTVGPNGTFNTNSLNIQADLIVVPQGSPVTATPIFTSPMPADTLSSSGGAWSSTRPSGYPSSTTFPPGNPGISAPPFYVAKPGSAGTMVTLFTSRYLRLSLYVLSVLLVGIAIMKFRSGIRGGRLTPRPAYYLTMAAVFCFLAWKSSTLIVPDIAHAAICCVPGFTQCSTPTATIVENGVVVIHQAAAPVCFTCPQCPGTGF